MSELLGRLSRLLRYRRNPALYVAAAVMAALTVWRLAQGMDPAEIVTEDYMEYLLVTGGALVTRLQVWAPESVDDLITGELPDGHEPEDV